jgi:hypothetical protein
VDNFVWQSIPEPASLMMVLGGAAALTLARRRRFGRNKSMNPVLLFGMAFLTALSAVADVIYDIDYERPDIKKGHSTRLFKILFWRCRQKSKDGSRGRSPSSLKHENVRVFSTWRASVPASRCPQNTFVGGVYFGQAYQTPHSVSSIYEAMRG